MRTKEADLEERSQQLRAQQSALDQLALEATRKELAALDSLGGKVSKAERAREKADYKRFFSIANKHLVFYSEGSGFYKYYAGIIDYVMAHSNLTVHYITNDPNDQVFALSQTNPRLQPYYIGEKKLITLFMKMDADVVVMTAPDLQTYHIKRSLVRSDVEYVYVDHGVSSVNLTMREGCVDHYDTILCVAQHEMDEIRAREQMEGLPPKKLIPCGYSLLKNMMDAYAALEPLNDGVTRILIGPSHQDGNILDSCLEPMVEQFLARGWQVTIRPHPQYIRRFPAKMEALRARWNGVENVVLEEDFSSNETVLRADLLVTDWSNISMEYAYATLRPVIFVDTPMKVVNPNWQKLGIEPVDLVMRRELGVQIDPARIEEAGPAAQRLLADPEAWKPQIQKSLQEHIFGVEEADARAGSYLIRTLVEKQKAAKAQN